MLTRIIGKPFKCLFDLLLWAIGFQFLEFLKFYHVFQMLGYNAWPHCFGNHQFVNSLTLFWKQSLPLALLKDKIFYFHYTQISNSGIKLEVLYCRGINFKHPITTNVSEVSLKLLHFLILFILLSLQLSKLCNFRI